MIFIIYGYTFGLQVFFVPFSATRVATRQPTLFVDYALPRQGWVAKMCYATYNPRRPRIAAQRRNLPIGHNPAQWDLRHQGIHPRRKVRINLSRRH
jgi:hypothetical protein